MRPHAAAEADALPSGSPMRPFGVGLVAVTLFWGGMALFLTVAHLAHQL